MFNQRLKIKLEKKIMAVTILTNLSEKFMPVNSRMRK